MPVGHIKHVILILAYTGPEFIVGMLLKVASPNSFGACPSQRSKQTKSRELLYEERRTMGRKEMGDESNGAPPVRTLLSRVGEAISLKSDCRRNEVSCTAWSFVQRQGAWHGRLTTSVELLRGH
jgi:hypothetical protein